MRIALSEFKYPFYCRHVYTHLWCQRGAERRGILFLEINPFSFYSFFERKSALKSILKWGRFCPVQTVWNTREASFVLNFISNFQRQTSFPKFKIVTFRGWKFRSSVWKSVTKRKILQNFRWKMKNATLFFHWSYTHITQRESSYAPSRRGSHCSGLVSRNMNPATNKILCIPPYDNFNCFENAMKMCFSAHKCWVF